MKAYLVTFEVDGVRRKKFVRASSVRSAIEQVKEGYPGVVIVGAGW